MLFLAIFLLVLFVIAALFVWLANNPGSVSIQWDWVDANNAFDLTLLQAILAVGVLVALIMMAWWVISGIINSPKSFGRWRSGRRRDKGYSALSRGLVAAGSGNAALARKLSKESGKLLENEPLVAMLDAQTSLLEGDRPEARKKFEAMLGNEETKLLGLRGLYVEAEQEGAAEAAAHFAKQANTKAPGTPWAALAVLKAQTVSGEWDEALRTLELNRSAGLYEKGEYKRKRAVILTAQAMDEEDASPDSAKSHALAAHKLAPDLVPAAVVSARACARVNDMRKAAKVLEASWKLEPHPEIAEAYIHLRSGDSAKDRLTRAEALAKKRANHTEGQFIVATAAIDAGEFKTARNAMEAALRIKPTERACLLMADIEEAEHGDRGRVREWLARAVTAPKDAAWTADGMVSQTWAPYSPVSGKLDAFEWKVPVEQIGGPAETADYSLLVNEPLEDIADVVEIEATPIAPIVAVAAAATTAEVLSSETSGDDSIEDAEIISEDIAEETIESKTKEQDQPIAEESKTPKSKRKPEKKKSTKSGDKHSPYTNTNMDEDGDGNIDHRPDDPGISKNGTAKKKGMFF
ncbi:MAG: heme biosynthesis HemY N-terminal domain-containing protein [Rhizobiaceae bacterium]